MNLAVDLGNSFIKYGVFEEDKLLLKKENISRERLVENILSTDPDNIIIGSVSDDAEALKEEIRTNENCLVLSHKTPVPINIKYKSPETLGVDRIAVAVGAQEIFPNQNCLVIDVGTCITYDLIDKKGNYLGGAISPGIDIKLRALHNYTAKLPLIDFAVYAEIVGTDTKSSILSGVVNGTIAEIGEMIRMYERKFAHLQIIICGGGSEFLKDKFIQEVHWLPELVLVGLNRILRYNVS
ncbi:type III pantothenate kinase [Fulvivirgaceae bacterium BMA10]|uniref:Type III pantothenate kinase n=1 Tax=Splendidivirga corallicola TaxID=3051826 RepID=A0ABT8KUJ1_9BACT|nr:type III pantothenate kinase [Fulvivirgaceae bacterium BMA10]